MNFREELQNIKKEKSHIKELAESFLADLLAELRKLPEDEFLTITSLSFEKGNSYICVGETRGTAYMLEKSFEDDVEKVFQFLRKKLKEEGFNISNNEEFYFEIEVA